MRKTIECPTCGAKQTVDACESCKGLGVKIPKLEESVGFPPALAFANCKECAGTGIKGGKVIVTI